MASSNTTTTTTTTTTGFESNGNSVPQWKRDLIQRRRQQSKVLASNGASVKLCSAVIGLTGGVDPSDPSGASAVNVCASQDQCGSGASRKRTREDSSCGGATGAGVTTAFGECPVACNMRLEVDVLPCSESEDVSNGVNRTVDMERKLDNNDAFMVENDGGSEVGNKGVVSKVEGKDQEVFLCSEMVENRGAGRAKWLERVGESELRTEVCAVKSSRLDAKTSKNRMSSEDGESDSSEELQYGPGIVNRLKSKYLNLTLREMNKSRGSVQRFRKAASLEDLLDCDDDGGEKSARKYTKITTAGIVTKTDRYRNASRGNDSMKRARSVETLLRYNASSDDVVSQSVPSRFVANALRQEPANDHIILIDRSSVKIESRLGEAERPKPLNKPKRIKPVLAETERPPPDLVKTTMRIFEGSAKKLKPKGEVAAKVATFKTINDTFKAQIQKKIISKPPLQPKPFVNGNAKAPGSPKKIVIQQKPTAELIEKQDDQEEYHNEGVITDPIVQSVSSVVNKFQQIEKSYSPSHSPEPFCKLKYSPVPSPEPPVNKLKVSTEIKAKSPPPTPVPSPRFSPPRVPSPASPKREISRQNSSPVQTKPSSPSPSRELFRQASAPESPKLVRHQAVEKEISKSNSEQSIPQVPERIRSPKVKRKDLPKAPSPNGDEQGNDEEAVDGIKTISKAALDNIGKAGATVQFCFNDKPTSSKSYLPKTTQNGQRSTQEKSTDVFHAASAVQSLEVKISSGLLVETTSSTVDTSVDTLESVSKLQERLESEKILAEKCEKSTEDGRGESTSSTVSKPIGAICSLGLIKSTTTTSYPQGNESKTIRSQKSDSPSPPQKQIGIIRPLVSTKTQLPQQNLSNRELEKNLINRVKSIEQPTKVVVSLKNSDEIQPVKKSSSGSGGLWDTKPWNQQNNTMVFNFSNRKDVPDYIENDGLIIRRKREKPKAGEGGIIVLDATLDASTTDEAEWEITGEPPSPCDVSFTNDNILINGRSNLSKQPRNHKHRIQFDDTATCTFEYPSEASMLEGEGTSVDGDCSDSSELSGSISSRLSSIGPTTSLPSLLGGGGLASYTPSKVDLVLEGFELGVTRTLVSTPVSAPSSTTEPESLGEIDYLKPAQDAGAWGSETTVDLLF